jgi:DNA repair exonuclease SbcCD nuclease subunit
MSQTDPSPTPTKNEKYWIGTADTQLGSIHWNNLQREQDYYQIFQELCNQAVNEPNCLGILGFGDLRERASIQAKNLGGLNRGLLNLLNAGKNMLAFMGNHDFTTPNWIEEMCYPSLHNLTNPEVQKRFGFDPETTLVLDFKTRAELIPALTERDPKKMKVVMLHQSLRELTTSMKQSYDISLEQMHELGFGAEHPCVVLLGDLHNYGDASVGQLQAVYPGSPEMTDINEGMNGLRSERMQSSPHDYRKFALRYYPESNTWEPFELNPRPWFRGKAKTPKEADRILSLAKTATDAWQRPGCITLTVPKKDLERTREFLRTVNTLEGRVEEYNPEAEEDENEANWEPENTETEVSWKENKRMLMELAFESKLPEESIALLNEIVKHDGSTPNVKNDVAAAWSIWCKDPSAKEETPEAEASLAPTFEPVFDLQP